MRISVPASQRKKALIVVDVQPLTMADSVKTLIPSMVEFVSTTFYPLSIVATWHSGSGSTFDIQRGYLLSEREAGETAPELLDALHKTESEVLSFHKQTRSAFDSDSQPSLLDTLKARSIEEVHIFGVDINDCVLATAYDAADYGFLTCVIEELSHHAEGDEELKESALRVLRQQSMTNNSWQWTP